MSKQILVSLDCIDPNPYQPPSARNEEKVLEIAQSIEQNFADGVGTKGLNQVPTAREVNGRYQLAFGHHRHQAFTLLFSRGRDDFGQMPLIIEKLTDQQMFESMATENLQRREISFIEETEIFHLYEEAFHKNHVETAQRFQKTEEHVRGRLMFLQLPDEAKAQAREGKLNVSAARVLVSLNKIGGEKEIAGVLKAVEKGKDAQEAMEDAIHASGDIVFLDSSKNWFSAGKNFPRKHLKPLDNADLVSILHVSSDSENRAARELLGLIRDGQPFADEQFPMFAAGDLERLRTLINPPACEKCPFHTSVNGSHYCGIVLCRTRKEEAWDRKELDDISSNLGIPLYQKSDGQFIELNRWDDKDRKLFKDVHADLRLAPATHMWNNFEGVGMDLKVVLVGDTARKRIEAAQKENNKRDTESKNRQRDYQFDEVKEQFEFRFGWEVASLAFASALDGVHPQLIHFLLTDMMEYIGVDTQFPQGSDDHDELVAQALKMKKADSQKQLRRIAMYDFLFAKCIEHLQTSTVRKNIINEAQALREVAEEWGIKLPRDFDKQAASYQTELEAAIKELRKA